MEPLKCASGQIDIHPVSVCLLLEASWQLCVATDGTTTRTCMMGTYAGKLLHAPGGGGGGDDDDDGS